MTREVELSALDLRYESYRMRNPALEARLLASIAERGIEEPLEGVDGGRPHFAERVQALSLRAKLRIRMAPYASLGEDEALGIVNLLRVSNDRSLTILEQARFIDELTKQCKMTVADIAAELSRSKSWVSMRRGLMGEMTPKVREKLFSGSLSRLSLHVHVAAVHAHERGEETGDRRLRGGAERQEAQRARD